uniref:RanBP2-type domain-containing protein n=1 Tax=Chaetoceros debilis TaxID=122233 RepID=A0A7S3QGT6_9STRA|mmetsp:Transcript_793/g.1211  ORF Transcript_793/g.1211 Transcript_793/m.1211 type:complete len:173 (+) Transcript_793:103-621(+)
MLFEMSEYATTMPSVNQLELHPRFSSPELRRVAAKLGVQLMAYGSGNSALIEKSPVVAEIAARVGKSPVQVALKWTLQHGVAVVAQSKTPTHIVENSPSSLEGWELSTDDMAALDAMDESYPYYWDPVATEITVGGWSCTNCTTLDCTYINKAKAKKCEICGSNKSPKKRKV